MEKAKLESASSPSSCSSSFCDLMIRLESMCCSMGDMWGRIESSQLWGLWWIARHMLYAGISIGIIIIVPTAILPIAAIFLMAHLYKFVRFLVLSAYGKRRAQRPKSDVATTLATTSTGAATPATTATTIQQEADSGQVKGDDCQV